MKKFSDEHRRKMSEAHKGKPSGMLGKTHSDETKAKMAQAHVGKKHSEETIAKMAAKRAEYWKKQKQIKEVKPEQKGYQPGYIGGLKIATYQPKDKF